jgi:hypothetical protein
MSEITVFRHSQRVVSLARSARDGIRGCFPDDTDSDDNRDAARDFIGADVAITDASRRHR